MTLSLQLSGLLALLSVGLPPNPPDGVYVVREKGEGTQVARNDTGAPMVLVERLTDKLGTASIASLANDNSDCSLDLRGAGPIPKERPSGSLAVLIGNRCLMVYAQSDVQPDGTINLSTRIRGEDKIQEIAKALNIEPRWRTHPGYKFAVSWHADKLGYRVGEPIGVKVRIKNVGEQAFTFMNGGRQRGPRDNQFGFTAFRGYGNGKAVPDTGDPTNFGGLGGYVTLQPGEVFEKSVGLEKWFQFTDPDSYLITGTFRLEFQSLDRHGRTWDDFATGTCVVTIQAPKKE